MTKLFIFAIAFGACASAFAQVSPSPVPQLPDANSVGLLSFGLTAWKTMRNLGDMPLAGVVGAIVTLIVNFFKTGTGFELFQKVPDKYKTLFVTGVALLASLGVALLTSSSIVAGLILTLQSAAAGVFFHEVISDIFAKKLDPAQAAAAQPTPVPPQDPTKPNA